MEDPYGRGLFRYKSEREMRADRIGFRIFVGIVVVCVIALYLRYCVT